MIVFATNASPEFGLGHFFRCYALAQRIRERSQIPITFVGVIESVLAKEALRDARFDLISDPTSDPTKVVTEFVSQHVPVGSLIVIDMPDCQTELEKYCRSREMCMMGILDRPNGFHDLDIVLSPNLFLSPATAFDSLIPKGCELFVGPSFLPLRKEFYNREITKTSNFTVSSFFGATDPGNQTGVVLEVATMREFEDIDFHLLRGPFNMEFFAFSEAPRNVSFLDYVEDMPSFWMSADIAIGSYGTATWERCHFGIPTISTIQSEDQTEDSAVLRQLGAVMCLGLSSQFNVKELANALLELKGNEVLRSSLSTNSLSVMKYGLSNSGRLIDYMLERVDHLL
jgi:UDP-2,4-diacetamido-2,4,6-trideoxy-beta-L-altropyranose hydrolase